MNTPFLNNKYTARYYKIINTVLELNRKKLKRNNPDYRYYELHHIIPKSLGGDNSSANLIPLTPREHYICHLLLTRMTEGKNRYKMLCAFNRITNRGQAEIKNSRLYNSIREDFSKSQAENYKGDKNHFYGKTHTKEIRDYLAEVCPRFGKDNGNFGKSLSQSQKDAISKSNKSRKIIPPPPQLGSKNHFSKIYKIIDPTGNKFTIKCMSEFCERNNLCSRTMILFKDKGKIPELQFEREYRVKNLQAKKNCEGYSIISMTSPLGPFPSIDHTVTG